MTTTTTNPITRTGKIARLPRTIRETLNHRLADGEPGNNLLDWLNQQPLVQETLARLFEGRAITAQNLSEWKKGGYQDWLRHQENLTSATLALEEAQDLETECGQGHGLPLSDRLSSLAALALAKAIRTASATPDSPSSLRTLLQAIQTLNTLRYADHQAARLKITLERREEEKAERAKTEAAASTQMTLKEIMEEITGVKRPKTPPPSSPNEDPDEAVPAASPTPPPPSPGSLQSSVGFQPTSHPKPPVHSNPFQVNPGESNHPLSSQITNAPAPSTPGTPGQIKVNQTAPCSALKAEANRSS